MQSDRSMKTVCGKVQFLFLRRVTSLLFLSLLMLGACDDGESKYLSGPAEVQILDKTFMIPGDWQYWRYAEMTDPNRNNAKYKQFWFEVDERTFENIKPNYEDIHGISIEIRPLRSEFGEVLYWTDKDRVHEAKVSNCHDYTHKDETYEVCEHESKHQLASFASVDFQSIRNKKNNQYISVLGCSRKTTLNQICVGRAIVLDDIQTEYSYRAEHYDRAIELDFKIRDLILSLLKPMPNEEKDP